jgi:hypothetical protein
MRRSGLPGTRERLLPAPTSAATTNGRRSSSTRSLRGCKRFLPDQRLGTEAQHARGTDPGGHQQRLADCLAGSMARVDDPTTRVCAQTIGRDAVVALGKRPDASGGDLSAPGRGARQPSRHRPRQAEQTVTGTASVGRRAARSVRRGGPGAGPLPGGWVDGIREGKSRGQRCGGRDGASRRSSSAMASSSAETTTESQPSCTYSNTSVPRNTQSRSGLMTCSAAVTVAGVTCPS